MYACVYRCHSLCKLGSGSIEFVTRLAGTVLLCDTNLGQERMMSKKCEM